jgi:hypothetical protein
LFHGSLREAWEKIRRLHLEANDLAELTGDNRELVPLRKPLRIGVLARVAIKLGPKRGYTTLGRMGA